MAIPARDESAVVDVALRAVLLAAQHRSLADVPCMVVVADDDSTDGTGRIAGEVLGSRGEVLTGSFGTAGAARRAAFARLLDLSKGLPAEHVWLATTDADSLVPPSWLTDHLRWWREGADAVAGLVSPAWDDDVPPGLRQRYEHMMDGLGTAHGHPHVYGANLGCTAEAYVRCGGVPALATSEDHALWNALRSSGAHTIASADEPVATSTRLLGRAPGGFAALLTGLSEE